MEQDEYIRRLNHCGVSLNDSPDAIIWNCNTSLGVITAILAYAEIVLSSIVLMSNWWNTILWNQAAPLKVKKFCWLVLEHKILSWDNLIKRGFAGPSIFSLYSKAKGTVNNLFIFCSFSQLVWKYVFSLLRILGIQGGISFEECLHIWIHKEVSFENIYLFVIQGIWRRQKSIIFYKGSRHSKSFSTNIVEALLEGH